jgi:hypothetical protein
MASTGQVLVEHLAVEEEEGAEGLVLGGGGDIVLHGQVSEKGFDLRCAHLGGMTFVVEKNANQTAQSKLGVL